MIEIEYSVPFKKKKVSHLPASGGTCVSVFVYYNVWKLLLAFIQWKLTKEKFPKLGVFPHIPIIMCNTLYVNIPNYALVRKNECIFRHTQSLQVLLQGNYM